MLIDTRVPQVLFVYITSETRLFREGLAAMLSRDGRIYIIGHGPSAIALEEIGHLEPELVLLDMVGARQAWPFPADSI